MRALVPLLLLPIQALARAHGPVLHAAPELPTAWQRLSRPVADDHPVVLLLSLRQTGIRELYDAVRRVSDPRSPTYGQYLTQAEVEALTAPAPSSADAVERWLAEAGVPFSRQGELVRATLTVALASELLQTRFRHVVRRSTSQRATVAGDFSLPADVHAAVAAVYGLHGLPLPPRRPLPSASPLEDSNTTPSVIREAYGVSAVTPSGQAVNRQAVAEFQDQTMSPADLEAFFRKYVAGASASAAAIAKFVGDNGTVQVPGMFGPGWGVEASLDVDYIMGVAPGVQTEFWYFGGADFCRELRNWTSSLVASAAPPLVNSVSWGFQGNVSEVGCPAGGVEDIDANLAKLAARGITVIVASGDSGSGYVELPKCDITLPVLQDTGVTGTVKRSLPAMEANECCRLGAEDEGIKAWSFTPPAEPGQCKREKGVALEGELAREEPTLSEAECCNEATLIEAAGYTFLEKSRDGDATCRLFRSVTGRKPNASAAAGSPDFGTCLAYSEVTGTRPQRGATSGGDGVLPVAVKLWPSWPASSPMVTAVGATRLTRRNATGREAASLKFGSGGGFSDYFPAFAEQAAAVAQYLRTAPGLPPNASFPPGGRATPDVSALGEDFMVMANGKEISVDGTSASAPLFAALVSLLNEARLQAGQPPMGYLNPWLYSHPEVFTDVTHGSNAIGRGTGPIRYGFNCTAGWDPVTGLGTPIFGKMLAAALAAWGGEEVVV